MKARWWYVQSLGVGTEVIEGEGGDYRVVFVDLVLIPEADPDGQQKSQRIVFGPEGTTELANRLIDIMATNAAEESNS